MVLVFYNELPPGNKFVTFFSRKRNNSITVDTTQENAMVLYALIPSKYYACVLVFVFLFVWVCVLCVLRGRGGEGERWRGEASAYIYTVR